MTNSTWYIRRTVRIPIALRQHKISKLIESSYHATGRDVPRLTVAFRWCILIGVWNDR
jgi:hypothetical protein